MRLEKYIEERFPRYFVFGGSDGKVGVASTQHDTIATVTAEQAKLLIEDRDRLVGALVKLAEAVNRRPSSAVEVLDEILGYR